MHVSVANTRSWTGIDGEMIGRGPPDMAHGADRHMWMNGAGVRRTLLLLMCNGGARYGRKIEHGVQMFRWANNGCMCRSNAGTFIISITALPPPSPSYVLATGPAVHRRRARRRTRHPHPPQSP